MTRTESLGEVLSSERYLLVAEGVREGPVLALEDVVREPRSFAGRALRIEGVIREATGEQLTLAGPRSVVVRFTSEAAFGEVEVVGRTARFEGMLSISDGGELVFAATGGAIEK